MSIIIPVAIISFLLDSIISNLINTNSMLLPLCTIVSLIIIYPYFNKNDISYLKWIAIIGLLYDIAYTDTFLLNCFLFTILALMVKGLNFFLSNNLLNTLIMTAILIISYRILTYIILLIIGYLDWNGMLLLKSIYSSLILNLIYATLIFLITDLISRRHKIRKAE